MNRNDLILVGLGGGGSRLVDSIVNNDPRFASYYINTSITDIEALETADKNTKNYFCISTNNGVGRNRDLGKSFAKKSGYSIIDIIERFNQDVIYFVSSLGGGSGSALLSELLRAIETLKSDPDSDFNKIINIIGILPDLKSPTVILKNARDTWNEIMNWTCVNSMIFVNNNCKLDENYDSADEKEIRINEMFSEYFSSIFDIPVINGVNFDNGNLTNILTDKGCLYFYDLPNDCSSIEVAMSKSENNSILGRMYIDDNSITITDDNKKLINCSYLGISFINEDYNKNYIFNKYLPKTEPYVGENAERNLLLISGCLPPLNDMKIIDLELKEREKNIENENTMNFSNLILNKDNNNTKANTEKNEPIKEKKEGKKKVIKKVKKGLF